MSDNDDVYDFDDDSYGADSWDQDEESLAEMSAENDAVVNPGNGRDGDAAAAVGSTAKKQVEKDGGSEEEDYEDDYEDDYDDDFEDSEDVALSRRGSARKKDSGLPPLMKTISPPQQTESPAITSLRSANMSSNKIESMGNIRSFADLIASEQAVEGPEPSESSAAAGPRPTASIVEPVRAAESLPQSPTSKRSVAISSVARSPGGIPQSFEVSNEANAAEGRGLEGVSARTSVAILSMIGRFDEDKLNRGGYRDSEEVDPALVGTLDWLASAETLGTGRREYNDGSFLSNPMLKETVHSATKGEAEAARHTLPGGVDEAVMKLVYECILDDLKGAGMVNRASATSPGGALQREDDSVKDIVTEKRAIPTNWTVPQDDPRVGDMMPIVEEQYLQIVRKMTKVNLDESPSHLAFSQHASVDRMLKIQKHMVNIMCDIFTDPSVIQTVKMGVTSRVLNEEDEAVRSNIQARLKGKQNGKKNN